MGDSRLRRWAAATSVGAAMFLGACTMQPLYAPSAVSPNLQAALNAIVIDETDDLTTQEIRNTLIFALGGGAPTAYAAYRMELTSTSGGALAVSGPDEARRGVSVTARYGLTEIATGRVIIPPTAVAAVTSFSLTRPTQGFADQRALEDARRRAAQAVAERIRLAVSLAFAAPQSTATPSAPVRLVAPEERIELPPVN